MPFPESMAAYKGLLSHAEVISTAIESLNVQVDWSKSRIEADPNLPPSRFVPLIRALADINSVPHALQDFTRRIFVFGNLTLFVGDDGTTKLWPSDWRTSEKAADFEKAIREHGKIVEVRRPPVVNGYGTPFVEAALAPFQSYEAVFNAQIAAMDALAQRPDGPIPSGSQAIVRARNAVLIALGFDSAPTNDLPLYRRASQLRDEIQRLFVEQLLRPYANMVGLDGNAVDLAIE